MSTRATYRFKSNEKPQFQTDTTIYIHHDGYPTGAASHFYNALIGKQRNRNGGAEAMILSNDEAEITKSHEVHGDTEYRYDVQGWGHDAELKAYKRIGRFGPHDDETWEIFYTGTIAEFIKQNENNLFVENYSPFRKIKFVYGWQWHNLDTAKRRMGPATDERPDASILGHLLPWIKNGHTVGANWAGMILDYQILVKEFPELADETVEDFLAAKKVGV